MQPFWKCVFTIGSRLKAAPYLSILIYHQILPEPDELRFDGVDASQFAQQMNWVKDHFNVLPLNVALQRMKQGCMPSRSACITFDDGYLDNFSIALPILKKLNLPASFYVSSQMIGSDYMWHDQIIEVIRHARKTSIDISGRRFELSSTRQKIQFLQFFEMFLRLGFKILFIIFLDFLRCV